MRGLSVTMRARATAGLILTLAALAASAAEGPAVFAQNCLMCHQSEGAGLSGQFPRLAGRAALISAKPKGRAYLIHLLTYGMTGSINVDGADIIGLMPPFAALSDDDVAAALNYVQSLGDRPKHSPAPFTAAEVHAVRGGPPMSAAGVHAERQTLGLAKSVP